MKSINELRANLRALGFSPDLIERFIREAVPPELLTKRH